MKKMMFSPSLMCMDLLSMKEQVEILNERADFYHVDIMDGHFVPNLTFGPPVVAAIRKVTKLPLDVHLMVTNPAELVEQFAAAGADWLTVHVETEPHLHRLVNRIRELGVKPAVTLNPATPIGQLDEILSEVDMVLVMSVNPGFGGQEFIEHTLDKIGKLKSLIAATGSHALIEVDGGVQKETAPRLKAAGVDVLVSGSFVFKSFDPLAAIRELKA